MTPARGSSTVAICAWILVPALAGPALAWQAPEVVQAAVPLARDLRVADIDGDGDQDLVGAFMEGTDGLIAWWENPGGGPVGEACDGEAVPMDPEAADGWTRHTVASLEEANWIRVGDIDGDGDPDLLGDSATLGGLWWWENVDAGEPGSGTGGAWTEHTFGAPQQLHRPSLVDFDGDGDLDMVSFVFPTPRVSWWENTSEGWVEHVVVQAYPDGEAIALAADLDGDGDLDIVVSRTVSEEVGWYENQDGTWLTHTVNRYGVEDIHAVDMDGDEDLDLLGGPRVNGNAYWYENKLDEGGFVRRTLLLDDGVSRLVPGDVDDDGDVDVWIGFDGESRGLALLENQDGLFVPSSVDTLRRVDGPLRFADLDGEGAGDLISAASSGIAWWAGDANRTRRDLTRSLTSDPSVEAVAADLDDDGDTDLAVSVSDNHLLLMYEQGETGWSRRCIDDAATRIVGLQTGDLDADGTPELAAVLYGEGQVVSWRRVEASDWARSTLGSGFFVPEPGVGPGWAALRLGDVDGDGDLDALAAGPSSATGGDFWFQNNGDGANWPRASLASNRVADFDIADADGDGDLDLLGVFSGATGWAFNDDGGASWEPVEALDWNYGITGVQRAGDLDGDGDIDVVRASWWGDDWTLGVLRNDAGAGPPWGVGSWVEAADLGTLAGWSLGDVDGDRSLEIAARDSQGRLTILSHEADLSAWATTPMEAPGPQATLFADVDQDKDEDLVSIGIDGSILWFPNDLPQWEGDDDDDDDDATDDDDDATPPPVDDPGPCGSSVAAAAGSWGVLLVVALRRRRLPAERS